MGRKYKLIFLMLLLCRVSLCDMYSQGCLTLQYDKDGNRIGLLVSECGSMYKETTRYMVAEESEYGENAEGYDKVMIYPNPNNGKFRVNLNDEESVYAIQIYNGVGVVVLDKQYCCNHEIDISDHPTGIYLIRIIKDDYTCERVVVKL